MKLLLLKIKITFFVILFIFLIVAIVSPGLYSLAKNNIEGSSVLKASQFLGLLPKERLVPYVWSFPLHSWLWGGEVGVGLILIMLCIFRGGWRWFVVFPLFLCFLGLYYPMF